MGGSAGYGGLYSATPDCRHAAGGVCGACGLHPCFSCGEQVVNHAQMSDARKYRAESAMLHKAGKHQESIDTLAKATVIPGIK